MKISNRVEKMEYSAIRKLVPYANKTKERGIEVIHLNIGAPDTETPKEFLEGIENVNTKTIGYSDSAGELELRKAIGDFLNDCNGEEYFNYEDVAVTSGASEALLFIAMITCEPGDSILMSDPYYANYKAFVDQAGVELVTFNTNIETGFRLPDYEEVKESVKDNTKAILICNPGNPTGKIYSREEIEMIIKLALEKDLFIIADEIYRDFLYTDEKFISFSQYEEIEDRLILVDSVSKRFSACGARIGAIISKNKDVMDQAVKLCTARLAVATLEQFGAIGLYRKDKSYLKEVREIFEKRRDALYNGLNKIQGVKAHKSQGAFYIMAELPIDDSDKFCRWILEEFQHENQTIMVAPATGFYSDPELGKKQVRLAFPLEVEKLERACELLELALEKYN